MRLGLSITFRIAATLLLPIVSWAGESQAPAAIVGDDHISSKTLEEAVAGQLLKLRTEEYQVRRKALELLVDERLLEQEAQRRGLTSSALLNNEASKVRITPEDIESVYDFNRSRLGGADRIEINKQIEAALRRQRVADARELLLQDLKRATVVRRLVEPPRLTADVWMRMVSLGASVGGDTDAIVTIVEYSDFECPYCAKSASTLVRLRKTFGDKVRVVHRDYVLESHRNAQKAAEAARCAARQGKFAEMHARLFENQSRLAVRDLNEHAASLGIEPRAFQSCLDSSETAEAVLLSIREGVEVGVSGTPTLFVNGRLVSGAVPFETLSGMVAEELDLHAARQAAQALFGGGTSDRPPSND
jgi:protein-disulfide isomerase